MKLFFATDHAGLKLKDRLVVFVGEEFPDIEVVDEGAFGYDESDDYPDYVKKAAEAVAEDPENCKAIILGGSGQGEAMVANRFNGVRAAVYYGGSEEIVRLSREHNDANVLSLGARFLTDEEAESAVRLWLSTDFSGDKRHVRRIEKIDQTD